MDNWLKIINVLGKNVGESFTIRGLSIKSKVSYATTYRLIKRFKKYSTHLIKTVGRAETIKINPVSENIVSFLTISSQNELLNYLEKNKIINEIRNKVIKRDNIVLLFGSYAKNEQNKNSDIDLLIINKTGNKDYSFHAEELLFNIKINPIYIKESEFKEMLKEEQENVGKQALKTHVLLSEPNKFWRLIINEFK